MIYAIRAVGTQYIKFGLAENVEKRLRFLQTGCPLELWLEDRGEWFKDCEEAQKIMTEMKAGNLLLVTQAAANDIRLEQRHKRLSAVLDFNERKTRQWGI